MRGKKLAFVFTEEKDSDYFLRLYSGLFASFKYLTHNFQVKVFTHSNQMNVIQRGFYDIYLRESIKTMMYAVNMFFEPTHVFFVSPITYDFEKFTTNKGIPRYLIHKGNKFDKEKESLFNKIIVELPEETQYYNNSIHKTVVNTDIFKPINMGKFYTVCMPQEKTPNDDEIFPNIYGSISWAYDTTINLPLQDTDILNVVLNQSKCVLLLNDNDSIEFALSAMACNTPVVAVEGTKACHIPGVLTAKRNTESIVKTVSKAWDVKYPFRDAFVLPVLQPKDYAKTIMEIIE